MRGRVFCFRRQVEFNGDAVQKNAVENSRKSGCRKVRAVTIGAGGARADQHEAGGAAFEVFECERVRYGRIGMIDPRHDLPRSAGRARCERRGIRAARIERVDAQTVIGFADQLLFERGAFERLVDQSEPLLTRGSREFRGEREVVLWGTRHAPKMPWLAANASLWPTLL